MTAFSKTILSLEIYLKIKTLSRLHDCVFFVALSFCIVALKHILSVSLSFLSTRESAFFFFKVSFWTIMKHKVKLIRELLFYITSQMIPPKKVILAVSKYQYREPGRECECYCWPWLPGAVVCWTCCPGLCVLCGKNILSESGITLVSGQ